MPKRGRATSAPSRSMIVGLLSLWWRGESSKPEWREMYLFFFFFFALWWKVEYHLLSAAQMQDLEDTTVNKRPAPVKTSSHCVWSLTFCSLQTPKCQSHNWALNARQWDFKEKCSMFCVGRSSLRLAAPLAFRTLQVIVWMQCYFSWCCRSQRSDVVLLHCKMLGEKSMRFSLYFQSLC